MNIEQLPDQIKKFFIEFEETKIVVKRKKCPKCKKISIERRLFKEDQQSNTGRWYVERCTNKDCSHWDCGWT